MNIIELKERQDITSNIKLNKTYIQLGEVLKELKKKELSHKIVEFVNQDIIELNSTHLTGNELQKLVNKKQTKILNLVETEFNIVPKSFYYNRWFVLGMCFGIVFGLIIGNLGLLWIALAIGMAIMGIALGAGMDKKAAEEGRQLDIKIEHYF